MVKELPLVKPLSKFGIWYPIVNIIVSTIIAAFIFAAGVLLFKWDLVKDALIFALPWYILWGLFAWLAWKLSKTKLKQVFSAKYISIKNILIAIIIAIVAQMAVILSTNLVSELSKQKITGNADGMISSQTTLPSILLIVSITVILAPLFEEIMFRGLFIDGIFNTSRKLKASPKTATIISVIITSLLFGIAHVSSLDLSGLVIFCVTGFLGAYLGYLRIKTGSLTLGIITHALFNSVTIVLLIATL